MAKKNKIRYRKGGPARLDMRKGGRVQLHGGGHTEERESGTWIPHNPSDPNHMGGANNNNNNNNNDETEEEKAARLAAEEAARLAAEQEAARIAAEKAAEAQAAGETTEQKQATRTRVEEGLEGTVPESAKIPDAEKIDTGLYTSEAVTTSWQKGGKGGTLSKNEQGHTAKDIFEGISSENPEFSQYELTDAIALLQAEKKLIGQPDPDSPVAQKTTTMAEPTAATTFKADDQDAEAVAT